MKKLFIILLLLTLLTPTALADTIEPLYDLVTIEDFPDDIKSGETYTTEFTFSSTHNTLIFINFTITHPDTEFAVEYNEWDAHFVLNGTSFELNESSPGHFASNATPINIGDHILNFSFSSLPNIVPGQYKYDFNLSSQQIEVPSTRSRRSGGSSTGSWIITISTATPTPTPTVDKTSTSSVSQVPKATEGTPEPTPETNITTEQTVYTSSKEGFTFMDWFAVIIFILMIPTLILLKRWKVKKTAENKEK